MAVIRKRNRLVSFRLSEQEYDALQDFTVAEGARSISDFARTALCDIIDGSGVQSGSGHQPKGNSTNQAIQQLVATMGELNRVISRLSILVESNSGNGGNR